MVSRANYRRQALEASSGKRSVFREVNWLAKETVERNPLRKRDNAGDHRTLFVEFFRVIELAANLVVLGAHFLIYATPNLRLVPVELSSRIDPSQLTFFEEFPGPLLMRKINARIQQWPSRDADTLRRQQFIATPVTSNFLDDLNAFFRVACFGRIASLEGLLLGPDGLH